VQRAELLVAKWRLFGSSRAFWVLSDTRHRLFAVEHDSTGWRVDRQ
jgi:hypothetical protein